MRTNTQSVKFVPPTHAEILVRMETLRGYLHTPEGIAMGDRICKCVLFRHLLIILRELNTTSFPESESHALYNLHTQCINKLNTVPR